MSAARYGPDPPGKDQPGAVDATPSVGLEQSGEQRPDTPDRTSLQGSKARLAALLNSRDRWLEAVAKRLYLTLAERVVALTLAMLFLDKRVTSSRFGMMYPAIETLAERSGVKIRVVQRALKKLRGFGLLEVVGKLMPGAGRATHYRFAMVHPGAPFPNPDDVRNPDDASGKGKGAPGCAGKVHPGAPNSLKGKETLSSDIAGAISGADASRKSHPFASLFRDAMNAVDAKGDSDRLRHCIAWMIHFWGKHVVEATLASEVAFESIDAFAETCHALGHSGAYHHHDADRHRRPGHPGDDFMRIIFDEIAK